MWQKQESLLACCYTLYALYLVLYLEGIIFIKSLLLRNILFVHIFIFYYHFWLLCWCRHCYKFALSQFLNDAQASKKFCNSFFVLQFLWDFEIVSEHLSYILKMQVFVLYERCCRVGVGGTSDCGNGNHSVSLPIILINIKVDQMISSSYINSLLVSILWFCIWFPISMNVQLYFVAKMATFCIIHIGNRKIF